MPSQRPHHPPWYRSLATRFAAVWAVLLGTAVGLVSWTGHREARDHLLDRLRQDIGQDSSEITLRLETWMRSLGEDTRAFSDSPLVTQFLDHLEAAEESRWRSLLEDEFRSVFTGKPAYFQMRLLSATGSGDGQELLRIDRKDGELFVTPADRLQNKAGRAYYQQALETDPGSVFLSEITLNRDFGTLTHPHIPTLRAAVRVGAGSGHPAIFIINADLRPLFAELDRLASPGAEWRLFDAKNDYLYHPDPGATFASDLGHGRQPSTEFPPSQIEAARTTGELWLADDVGAPALVRSTHFAFGENPSRDLTLLVSLPDAVWRPALNESRRRGIRATTLATLAGAAIALLTAWPFTARIRRLTHAIHDFDAHSTPSDPTDSPSGQPDEIGVAIERFRQLEEEIRAQVATLKSAKEDTERANATMEAFLAVMSHEIRTPMNAVVGLIRALRQNEPAPQQLPILSSLQASATNLMNLLNSALDYTRLRDGALPFAHEPFDAAAAVHEVCQAAKPTAAAKSLELQVDLPASLGVTGDPVRFRQIANNLVSNAIKFTPDGFVHVGLEHRDGELRLTVTDSGPGVDLAHREDIFSPFFTRDKSGVSSGGAGLGLAVSSEIAAQQGGELSLTDPPEGGARFTARLPYPPAELDTPVTGANDPPSPEPGTLSGLHVLYAEDVGSNQQVMSLTLAPVGIELTCAPTATECLGLLSETAPDIVLVDLQLPDMPGDALAEAIHDIAPQLPVVAVTAQSSAKSDERLRRAGIDAVVLKPFEADELLTVVADLTNRAIPDALAELHPDAPEKARQLAGTMAGELQAALESLAGISSTSGDAASRQLVSRLRHKLKTAINRFDLRRLDRALAALEEERSDSPQAHLDTARSALEAAVACLRRLARDGEPTGSR